MKTVVIIPARMSSTRFPGKPLTVIAGKSMIMRCWEIAKKAEFVDEVFVSSESEIVLEHARSFGAKTILTSDECRNGTERVAESVERMKINPEIIINFQGDTPLTPPWIINDLAKGMIDNPESEYGTAAIKLNSKDLNELLESKKESPASGTFVVFDKNNDALYFSKNLIPGISRAKEEPNIYRHIGIYAYRKDSLKEFIKMEETYLSKLEQLEQLRILENGKKIKVFIVDFKGRDSWSVDAPSDLSRVEQIIINQGEL